jgi:hypothetical protein
MMAAIQSTNISSHSTACTSWFMSHYPPKSLAQKPLEPRSAFSSAPHLL